MNASSLKVVHDSGNNADPGNETKCLDFPLKLNQCATSFKGGTLLRFERILWYLRNNERNGTSLYRKVNNGDPIEMVPDIDQLTLSFLYTDINGSRYLPLESIPDWTKVQAVRIMVRSVSTDKVGTDGQPLRREYPFTIALRNRLN